MRVSIIGAGIGGLALAQALHRAGIDVTVHDHDPHVAATGGYRLALDAHACAALRRALSPAHYQALLGSSAPPEASRHFTLADHELRTLSVISPDPSEESLFIGRVPLRTLLAEGLGDRVRFGVAYTGHEVRDDGRVVAHFDDGGSDVADVLVGADGGASRVATALAGRPTSAPCGYGCVAARVPLDDAARARLPAVLDGGPALPIGPGGTSMFLTLHDPASGATAEPSTCREVAAVTEAPALIWGFIAPDTLLAPEPTRALGGHELVRRILAELRRWPGNLRSPVADTDPATASYFRFHAADPDAELTPWPAGPVTALGDAVHAMPPTGGGSAAVAIRDADHLAAELVAARDGTSTIPLATQRFERTMTGYARERVRVSLDLLRATRRLSNPLASTAARVGLPALSALGLSRGFGAGLPATTGHRQEAS